MFKPSIYQQAVFSFITNDNGSAIIEAVAGSGKTTTIVQALNLIPKNKSVVFLAFNKSIATELQERVPKGVQCSTLNSLGHQAWYRHAGKVRVNGSKTRDVIRSEQFESEYERRDINRLASSVIRMVSIAKAVGLVPNSVKDANSLVPDSREVWDSLIDHYDIQFGDGKTPNQDTDDDKDTAIRMARTVLDISCKMGSVEIDFDDQLYLTVIFRVPVPKFDFVFVDEAQDVSDIQRALLAAAMKPEGRLIAVGDPHQAIYGFRGADSNSIENIARLFNAVRLPLSISYRCPKAVIREAQRYVSHIESHESAIEGEVRTLGEYKSEMFKPDDLVICRNMSPIVRLAYRLISAKVPARIIGRDMAAGLISLINKLNPTSIEHLISRLVEWKEREIYRLRTKDEDADISKIEDKYDVIHCFLDCSGARTVPELIQAIEHLFGDRKTGVILSTIHRAKGLEADNVFILDSWLMPSKYAKRDWQKQQETNIAYVAITRAKVTLSYISSPRKV